MQTEVITEVVSFTVAVNQADADRAAQLLAGVTGVNDVSLSANGREATITFNPGATSPGELETTLRKAGIGIASKAETASRSSCCGTCGG